jgi:hypothetical protein
MAQIAAFLEWEQVPGEHIAHRKNTLSKPSLWGQPFLQINTVVSTDTFV